MEILIPIALLVVILFGAYTTVTAPKVWQRTVSLLCWGIIVALIAWAAISEVIFSYRVHYHSSVVMPTGELWNITATNLANGNISQAISDVDTISRKWMEINTRNSIYLISDLVREIRENQTGEQGVPGYRRQSAPQPEP